MAKTKQLAKKTDVDALITKVNELSEYLDGVDSSTPINFSNSAAGHNGIYRGRDLTNIYTIDEICQMVSDGTFEDLYIGDYITVTIPDVSYTIGDTEYIDPSQEVDIVFADFNTIYDSNTTKNHITCVPRKCFNLKAAMNSTNTTEGGYVATDMHTIVLPAYTTALQEVLNNHIINRSSVYMTKSVNSDKSIAGAGLIGSSGSYDTDTHTDLKLLDEINLYGTRVCSSSYYDAPGGTTQFKIFQLVPTYIISKTEENPRQTYWLSAVTSLEHFATCSNTGCSYFEYASQKAGIRPYFLIG